MHILSRIARIAILLAASGAALAQDPAGNVRFNIPAQALETALLAFSQQAGVQVVVANEAAKGLSSQGVRGQYAVTEALGVLLQGSGLRYRVTDDHTIAIQATKAEASSAVDSASGAPSAMRLAQIDSRELLAAEDDSASGQRVDLEEVLVSGKPFTDANVDIVRSERDAQPYYIFKGEEIANANTVNMEDFLKQRLTMNTVAGTNSQSKNDYAGSFSQVNLRGLGVDRTLILVNGRRVTGADSIGLSSQFDINSLSPTMIERIEVLPSSASAIYGGSALGGVLNIILKRDFKGGDIQASYDTPLDASAPVRSISGLYGWSLEGGKTNITLSAMFRDNESLRIGDRQELLRRGFSRVLARAPETLGSSSYPYYGGGATPNIASASGDPLTFDNGTPLGSTLTYIPAGTSASTSAATLQAGLLANAGLQNTDFPDNQNIVSGLQARIAPVGEQKSVTATFQRQMTERLQLFAEFFHNENESGHSQAQPFRAFFVPGDSPSNPFQEDVLIDPPFAQTYSRHFENKSERWVTGFVLDLWRDWRAQGDFTWNRTENERRIGPFFGPDSAATDVGNFYAALDAGTFNPFIDTLANQQNIAPYATLYYHAADVTTLRDIAMRVSGPIGSLPAGRPNLTIGVEHRAEKQPWGYYDRGEEGKDIFFPQSQDVNSIYLEGLVPLVSPGMDVPAVNLLDLQIAGRLEDFSVKASTSETRVFPPDYALPPDAVTDREKVDYNSFNKTFGLRYKPVDSLMLRASYATAFLPPNFSQLLSLTYDDFISIQDPLRGLAIYSVPTAITGGNPNLQPESAKDLNFGLLFEPAFAPGLRMSLEYFRIKRHDLIFQPDFDHMLANPQSYPGRIVRAAPTAGDPYGVGPVTLLDYSVLNAGEVVTKGFDFGVGYVMPTERYGTFSFDLQGTQIDEFTQQVSLTDPAEDLADKIALGGPLSFRANASVGWQRGPWSASWTALHYGAYDQYDDPSYIAAQGSAQVKSQTYHNLLIGYQFGADGATSALDNALSGVTVKLGVQNVFDTMPPFDAFELYTQYYSRFGDYRLRTVRLLIGKRF